ncbi:MAG: translation initiation factor IF-3 [Endomicrobiaceae bacterium]
MIGTGIFIRSIFYFVGFYPTREGVVDTRKYRTNQYIRVPEVRLIDENGVQVGIVPIAEALSRAHACGQDLIEISPQAKPPVCKIIIFSKFRYELAKKEKEAKKKQKNMQLKEVRLRTRIAEHDLDVKLKRIRDFLEDGDKVQLTLMFSGREMQHKDLGLAVLEKIKEKVSDIATIEGRISSMGTRSFLTVTPKKNK